MGRRAATSVAVATDVAWYDNKLDRHCVGYHHRRKRGGGMAARFYFEHARSDAVARQLARRFAPLPAGLERPSLCNRSKRDMAGTSWLCHRSRDYEHIDPDRGPCFAKEHSSRN